MKRTKEAQVLRSARIPEEAISRLVSGRIRDLKDDSDGWNAMIFYLIACGRLPPEETECDDAELDRRDRKVITPAWESFVQTIAQSGVMEDAARLVIDDRSQRFSNSIRAAASAMVEKLTESEAIYTLIDQINQHVRALGDDAAANIYARIERQFYTVARSAIVTALERIIAVNLDSLIDVCEVTRWPERLKQLSDQYAVISTTETEAVLKVVRDAPPLKAGARLTVREPKFATESGLLIHGPGDSVVAEITTIA